MKANNVEKANVSAAAVAEKIGRIYSRVGDGLTEIIQAALEAQHQQSYSAGLEAAAESIEPHAYCCGPISDEEGLTLSEHIRALPVPPLGEE